MGQQFGKHIWAKTLKVARKKARKRFPNFSVVRAFWDTKTKPTKGMRRYRFIFVRRR